jgi:transcriptional regulator with XRE-family HTH domain
MRMPSFHLVDESAADPRSATIRHLRETVSARVENTSLRSVAREIGMSPSGLKQFLQGTAPYAPTLRRLRNWYVHYAAMQTGALVEQDASAALSVLVHDLSSDSRREIAGEILDSLARGYDHDGRPRPEWLFLLRHSYGVEETRHAESQTRPSALGKYGYVSGSSDDFARLKQAEIDREDRKRA